MIEHMKKTGKIEKTEEYNIYKIGKEMLNILEPV
jgi:hypothetical protein